MGNIEKTIFKTLVLIVYVLVAVQVTIATFNFSSPTIAIIVSIIGVIVLYFSIKYLFKSKNNEKSK